MFCLPPDIPGIMAINQALQPMKLSVVTTMYKSSPYLREFAARIERSVLEVAQTFELIFVNDGSPDDSIDVARQLQETDSRIQIVDLSRNFGHHAAIIAGIAHATGDYVFLIDCDLEEQPEWLPLFKDQLEMSGADVVFGVQKRRVASAFSNFLGSFFWRSLNVMSSVSIPHDPMTCRLMKRSYVDALLGMGDRVLYLAGVFAWVGFKQLPLALTKTPRPTQHRSTYGLSRKLLQLVDSFSSFSIAPLYLVFVIGLVTWLSSLVYAAFLLLRKISDPDAVLSGFTSMMLSIWFLSGFMIFAIGIIGLYLAKIFQEVKRRPLFITKAIHKGGRDE